MLDLPEIVRPVLYHIEQSNHLKSHLKIPFPSKIGKVPDICNAEMVK